MMTATAEVPDLLRCSDQAVGWARLMLQRDFAVVIDCETTDLPGALCEVTVVDTSGRVLLNSLVHPCQPITRAAGKVHNITEEMVAAAPTFPELFDDILRVTAGRRVLAYNAAFDRRCFVGGPVGAAWPDRRRVRPARTASTTTASAISRTARAIGTVPGPIPDWTAAGGVAGTTV